MASKHPERQAPAGLFADPARRQQCAADDGNNHFSDVFLLDKLGDYLFDDGFEPAQ